ncbi:hypothetical protein [Saccharomonospora iraqiensis]|uniref:hypothetical protein n=1 Tax=Saccharomonospora iraqiensis TaxID=52698 RepID=UPI00022E5397|nr:hypothetical protein [Saccharomonospora iraqiensis]
MSSDEQHGSSADHPGEAEHGRSVPAGDDATGRGAGSPEGVESPESAGAAGEADADSTGGAGTGDADPAVDPAADGPSRGGPPRWLVPAGAALTAASVLVSVVFGGLWWNAAASDDYERAAARDRVTQAASKGVIAFTELDHENPDAYFERQKKIVTGDLRKQIENMEQNYREAISKAKTTVTSTVQDVAVEELNTAEGTAVALATVSNEIAQGEQTATKVMRLQIEMKRTDEDGQQVWKVSNLGEVPAVGPAGQP